VVGGFAGGVALVQTDDTTGADVNGGIEIHFGRRPGYWAEPAAALGSEPRESPPEA
jgi:hypothetical protein